MSLGALLHKLLQWGRELTLAEISTVCAPKTAADPLQWGRELTLAEIAARLPVFPAVPELQWGRELTLAEMPGSSQFSASVQLTLQWGRELTLAEMRTLVR